MSHHDHDPLKTMVVAPDAPLMAVFSAIERGGKEVAFVLDASERIIGILTDGDVRRALLAGATLHGTPASEVMNRGFRSVKEDESHRAHALEAMVAYGIKQVPVVDREGRLVGLHAIEEYIARRRLPNWAVVLAGGRGRRLRPITEHIPKPMVKVAGRPILERLVMGLVGSGIQRVFLAVNYRKELIQEHFLDGRGHGCEVSYLVENQPLGTGGPLSLLPEDPTHPVLVLNGDLVGDFHFADLIHQHESGGHSLSVAVGLHSYEVPFGVVEMDDGVVREVVEKPRQTWWVNQGIYVISPEVLPLVPKGAPYPITDLIGTCIARGWSVGGIQLDGEWMDVGRLSDLARARGEVL